MQIVLACGAAAGVFTLILSWTEIPAQLAELAAGAEWAKNNIGQATHVGLSVVGVLLLSAVAWKVFGGESPEAASSTPPQPESPKDKRPAEKPVAMVIEYDRLKHVADRGSYTEVRFLLRNDTGKKLVNVKAQFEYLVPLTGNTESANYSSQFGGYFLTATRRDRVFNLSDGEVAEFIFLKAWKLPDLTSFMFPGYVDGDAKAECKMPRDAYEMSIVATSDCSPPCRAKFTLTPLDGDYNVLVERTDDPAPLTPEEMEQQEREKQAKERREREAKQAHDRKQADADESRIARVRAMLLDQAALGLQGRTKGEVWAWMRGSQKLVNGLLVSKHAASYDHGFSSGDGPLTAQDEAYRHNSIASLRVLAERLQVEHLKA